MAIVGIMDSGVGGLSVLREIRKLLPKEHYIYYSDMAYCPYGKKPPELIIARCRKIVKLMLSKGVNLMVIACNTATAVVINTLRNEFDIPFVGMVPALKPAVSLTRSGVVGVLATQGTLKSRSYLQLKNSLQDGVKIVDKEGKGFVELVENCELEGTRAEQIVGQSLRPLLDAGADNIVLGCTHYPFLLNVLEQIAGKDVSFINPAPAVARRVKEVLGEQKISQDPQIPGMELLSSGELDTLISQYKYLIGRDLVV